MDNLINLAIDLGDKEPCWFVCEVQIVHKQMLTVRTKLGAHQSYAKYRSAIELLECTGNLGLALCDERAAKRWALGRVLRCCRKTGGAALGEAEATDALVERQVWGLSDHKGRFAWPVLVGLDLGGAGVAEAVVQTGSVAAEVLSQVEQLGGASRSVLEVLRAHASEHARVESVGLEGHGGGVTSVCVTADGKHVVTGSYDKTARVWSLADGSHVRTLEGHGGIVSSVYVTADGKHVVTGSADKTARKALLC